MKDNKNKVAKIKPPVFTEKMTFNYLAPPEPVTCSPVPGSDNAPKQELLSPPKFKETAANDIGLMMVKPVHVAPSGGRYIFAPLCQIHGGMHSLSGEQFLMTNNAIYTYTKKGAQKESNFSLFITGFVHVYKPSGKFTEFITGVAQLENASIPWEVELKDYKKLLQILGEKFGETFVAKSNGDGVLELFSKLYAEAKNDSSIPIINKAEISGWYDIEGKGQWFTGIDDYYADINFPDTSLMNPADIFANGVHFLDIGHFNVPIGIIFLFAHAGFSRWWLQKAGISWRVALIVEGVTNSFKTSVVSLVANVFNSKREEAVRLPISLLTDAGGRRTFAQLRHQTILVDDYSKTTTLSATKSRELAESIIRMNGDSGGYIKAAPGNNKKTITEKIEGAVIFTCEKDFHLGNSSNTRCITVKTNGNIVDRNGNIAEPATFDAAVLSYFQQNHDTLKYYFALYIKFLTEKGCSLLPALRQNYLQFRNELTSVFHTPRMADSAAILRIQATLILEFAKNCGYPQIEFLYKYLDKCILHAATDQQQKTNTNNPADLFMTVLAEILDQTNVANDERTYVTTYDYYGFYQKADNTIWLKKEKIFEAVCNILRNRGTEWLETLDSIKMALHAKGYIRTETWEEDGKPHISFFPRAKKGTRKLMLVVFKEKLDSFGGILS